MNCCGISIQSYRAYTCLLKVLRESVASLFELFQRIASLPARSSPIPLSHRNIKVGGIVNSGHSCTMSVLLQEFAALPHFYDALLSAPLQQQPEESPCHLTQRKELQSQLHLCVTKVRSAQLVSRNDVSHLMTLLLELGWQNETTSALQRALYKWAPGIFTLPFADPYQLFEKVISFYPEASSDAKIALLGRTSAVAYRQLFEQSPVIECKNDSILWRVAEDYDATIELQENLQIKNRFFSLKLVHELVRTPRGNHVVIYRREQDKWICCNDVHVFQVSSPPLKNVYAVVYESQNISQ
jgi:hypothetical protein